MCGCSRLVLRYPVPTSEELVFSGTVGIKKLRFYKREQQICKLALKLYQKSACFYIRQTRNSEHFLSQILTTHTEKDHQLNDEKANVRPIIKRQLRSLTAMLP